MDPRQRLTQEEIAAIQLPDSPVVDSVDWETLENQRIIAHLDRVIRTLRTSTARSLDLAADRLFAAREG